MMQEKGLNSELITEFKYVTIMSKDSPLAKIPELAFDDLTDYIEIAHADPYVPSLPVADVKKVELPNNGHCRIFVFERGSQFELLSANHDTYMWVSSVPNSLKTLF